MFAFDAVLRSRAMTRPWLLTSLLATGYAGRPQSAHVHLGARLDIQIQNVASPLIVLPCRSHRLGPNRHTRLRSRKSADRRNHGCRSVPLDCRDNNADV